MVKKNWLDLKSIAQFSIFLEVFWLVFALLLVKESSNYGREIINNVMIIPTQFSMISMALLVYFFIFVLPLGAILIMIYFKVKKYDKKMYVLPSLFILQGIYLYEFLNINRFSIIKGLFILTILSVSIYFILKEKS